MGVVSLHLANVFVTACAPLKEAGELGAANPGSLQLAAGKAPCVCAPQGVQTVEELCPQGAEDPAAADLGVGLRAVRLGGPRPL